jgi:metal-responsive CopG/Arc/MetJ family transcriptional regulator
MFMAKAQVTISLDNRFLEWLDEGIKSLKFATRSHGIEYCINRAMQEEAKTVQQQGNVDGRPVTA